MTAVKIVKVLGTSTESWEDAAEEAVAQAGETIDDIRGVEVEDWTASVEGGQVTEYKATVEVASPSTRTDAARNPVVGPNRVVGLRGSLGRGPHSTASAPRSVVTRSTS
jgi:flavin-binding protein dodecin